jgi:hypothetical protein
MSRQCLYYFFWSIKCKEIFFSLCTHVHIMVYIHTPYYATMNCVVLTDISSHAS